jgi:hypothetical protein
MDFTNQVLSLRSAMKAPFIAPLWDDDGRACLVGSEEVAA